MKKRLCEICGKPLINQNGRGKIHVACDPRNHNNAFQIEQQRLRLLEKAARSDLTTKIPTRTWTRNQGRDRLAKLFPDMADRFGKQELLPKSSRRLLTPNQRMFYTNA